MVDTDQVSQPTLDSTFGDHLEQTTVQRRRRLLCNVLEGGVAIATHPLDSGVSSTKTSLREFGSEENWRPIANDE